MSRRLFKSPNKALTPNSKHKPRHNSTPRSTYYEILNSQQSQQDTTTTTTNSSDMSKEAAFNLAPIDTINLWIDNRDLTCKCPELLLNRKYLVMTRSYSLVRYLQSINNNNNNSNKEYSITVGSGGGNLTKLAGLLLDRETFITEWRGPFIRRMRRFARHFENGKCARFNFN